MKLEQMYLDFTQMDEPAQVFFIQEYRKKRLYDLSHVVTKTKTSSKVELTEEEKVMARLLGLKTKDMIALRAIGPLDEEEESGDLFDDTGLVEGDEL
jgi:hypothetical protein